ncbi:MAG: TldD/PmbA family protein, partial [Actinomycetota bacterium]
MAAWDLDDAVVRGVLSSALGSGGEFAEIFAEERISASIRLEDRKVEELSTGRDRGAGIRVIRGLSTAFAFTNRLDRDALGEAAKAAAAGLSEQRVVDVADLRRAPERVLNPVVIDPRRIPADQKVAFVVAMDDAARAEAGAEARQVIAAYTETAQEVLIANSEGSVVRDRRTRTRVTCQVVAARDGVVQTGFHSPGASAGFEHTQAYPASTVGRRAARQAVTMLDSIPAPAGEMPVVLAPGGGGVLFHEACGHGLEADLCFKGASVYKDRAGQTIGSALLSGVDQGDVPGSWGSFAYDDEGEPSKRTVLFEKGVLTGYMTDRIRAGAMDLPRSGNGRRQSYAHLPIPRMTNSSILPGDDDPDEIVRGTKRGLYAASFGGGQVNT